VIVEDIDERWPKHILSHTSTNGDRRGPICRHKVTSLIQSIANATAVRNGSSTPPPKAVQCAACLASRLAPSTSIYPTIPVPNPSAVSAEALRPVAHSAYAVICGGASPHSKAIDAAVVVLVIVANTTLVNITCTAWDPSAVNAGRVVPCAYPTKVYPGRATPYAKTICFAVVPVQRVTGPTFVLFSYTEQLPCTICTAYVPTIAVTAGIEFFVSTPDKHAVLLTVIQFVFIAHVALVQCAVAERNTCTVEAGRAIASTHIAHI
jgi:hypothetical protein